MSDNDVKLKAKYGQNYSHISQFQISEILAYFSRLCQSSEDYLPEALVEDVLNKERDELVSSMLEALKHQVNRRLNFTGAGAMASPGMSVKNEVPLQPGEERGHVIVPTMTRQDKSDQAVTEVAVAQAKEEKPRQKPELSKIVIRITITGPQEFEKPTWMERLDGDTPIKPGTYEFSLEPFHEDKEDQANHEVMLDRAERAQAISSLQQSLWFLASDELQALGTRNLLLILGTQGVDAQGCQYYPYIVRTTDGKMGMGWNRVDRLYSKDYLLVKARKIADAPSQPQS